MKIARLQEGDEVQVRVIPGGEQLTLQLLDAPTQGRGALQRAPHSRRYPELDWPPKEGRKDDWRLGALIHGVTSSAQHLRSEVTHVEATKATLRFFWEPTGSRDSDDLQLELSPIAATLPAEESAFAHRGTLRRQPVSEQPEAYELSQQEWEHVGQDNELEEMSAQEEDPTGLAQVRTPMRTVKRQSLNRMLRRSPTSPSPPGRKPMGKMNKARDTKETEPTRGASSSTAQMDMTQMNMAQMQAMMMKMQELMAQNLNKEQEPEIEAGARHRGRSKEPVPAKDKVKKTPRAVRTAALTGDEAPFPSLSTQFSDDPTMNLMISLRAQTFTFKWKLLLLMLRVKLAVEIEKRRWKRNPRWIMKMHGNHIASLWGHLGSARQLCYSPKKTVIGLEEVQTAVAAAVAARNLQSRVSGFSPIQLIFGREMSLPGNLMEAIAGQFKFQISNPQTMEEAIHRASSIRRAATEAFQWLEASDALKRAAGSRARLPRLELLVEGSMVMFYEPPVSRRGLARRLQDHISWIGPAVVVAVERSDGAVKRVWIRYRHKLRGLPLEHIRLATGDEVESTKVTKEALQDLMKQLQSGRVNVEIAEEGQPREAATRLEVALHVLECFQAFEATASLAPPTAHPPHRGQLELCSMEHLPLVPEPDMDKPETGKVRLELQWSQLSPSWQKAFEEPIIEALDIYFRHDALAPVMPEETVHESEVLPSRFVLVNKADPKNTRPTEADLELAKLKARLVIAGHRDQRAGDYATDAPTASLVAHNFVCFLAAQLRWRMYFADISAAFLQGDYLPEGRRVFVQSPKNYPLFVRQFLMTKVPPGARTDMFRMKKAGFGLAESPRLWYQRFSRDVAGIGGKELHLAPGVFAFYDPEGHLCAMLAVHVDDVRFISSEEAEEQLWPKLKNLFTLAVSDASFGGMPKGRSQGGMVMLVANPKILDGEANVNVLAFHSGLLKRVVRSSLAAEVSQAATAMEEADFLRALMAEALEKGFSFKHWLSSVSKWRQVAVMDSKTGYDLLNGTSLGEDKRLAIDVASMRQALQEDGGSRLVRWVPGEEILADDLTKLVGNNKLVKVMENGTWALKDTDEAKRLRADAAVQDFKIWFTTPVPASMMSVAIHFSFNQTLPRGEEGSTPLRVIEIMAPEGIELKVRRPKDVQRLKRDDYVPVTEWNWTDILPRQLWFGLDMTKNVTGTFHYSFPALTPSEEQGMPYDNLWQVKLCSDSPMCSSQLLSIPIPGFFFGEDIHHDEPAEDLSEEAQEMLTGGWAIRSTLPFWLLHCLCWVVAINAVDS
eukprot:g30134.t1